ncbi:MAG: hypothetical protein IPN26_03235 [Bacteroidetes bacterium]|nr:hypothetical protein [Bacteroidota bacterium]
MVSPRKHPIWCLKWEEHLPAHGLSAHLLYAYTQGQKATTKWVSWLQLCIAAIRPIQDASTSQQ